MLLKLIIQKNVFFSKARRVIVYLGRAKPDRLVDEMMNELRTIEPLTFTVERTQTPPFFRLSVKKHQNSSSDDEGLSSEDGESGITAGADGEKLMYYNSIISI